MPDEKETTQGRLSENEQKTTHETRTAKEISYCSSGGGGGTVGGGERRTVRRTRKNTGERENLVEKKHQPTKL